MIYLQTILVLIIVYLYFRLTKPQEIKIEGNSADIIKYFTIYNMLENFLEAYNNGEYVRVMQGRMDLSELKLKEVAPGIYGEVKEKSPYERRYDRCTWEPEQDKSKIIMPINVEKQKAAELERINIRITSIMFDKRPNWSKIDELLDLRLKWKTS